MPPSPRYSSAISNSVWRELHGLCLVQAATSDGIVGRVVYQRVVTVGGRDHCRTQRRVDVRATLHERWVNVHGLTIKCGEIPVTFPRARARTKPESEPVPNELNVGPAVVDGIQGAVGAGIRGNEQKGGARV